MILRGGRADRGPGFDSGALMARAELRPDSPAVRGIGHALMVTSRVPGMSGCGVWLPSQLCGVASTNRVGTNTGAKTQRIMTISQYQRTGRLTSHRTFAMAPGLRMGVRPAVWMWRTLPTWGTVRRAREAADMGLDGVELLMALEDEFEIKMLDEEAAKRPVGDLYDVIVRHLDRSQRIGMGKAWTNDGVWETLCRVTATQTGVKRAEIKREAAIVADWE